MAAGQGGSVTLKNSKGTTVHSGSILAKGGLGGAGGDADISGASLSFTGTVDLTAPNGKTGDLLIDPASLDVITGGAGTVVGGQNDSTSTAIDPATVVAALDTANLTLNADTNITVSNAIDWTSNNTLTLSTNTTGSTILLDAAINGVNGGLTIDTAGVGDHIIANFSVDVANFILENGSWGQNNINAQPAFTASNDFELQGGTFLRAVGGTGTLGSPYQIADIYGLQGLSTLLTKSAVLANNIDASGTATWNGGAGFVPIGKYDGNSNDAASYSGTFNGQGHIINGLTINSPSSGSGTGLFGDTAVGSTLENLDLKSVNITGGSYVGGLVGVNNATISDVGVQGAVTGTDYVGGLEGNSSAAISNCYSFASVTGTADGFAIGGLGGLNQGGTITDCYSSGFVTVGSGGSGTGGLLGSNLGTVTGSFWDTTTSGQPSSSGGTGDPTATLLMASTYSAAGWNIGTDPTPVTGNTWVILDGQTRPVLAMEYSTTISDPLQLQLIDLNPTTLAASYTLAKNLGLNGITDPSQMWATSTTNGGGGFIPIGSGTAPFTGTFNGQEHTLGSLYIDMPGASYVGLFGVTSSAALVENVGVTSAQISGGSSVGALVGDNDGMVKASYAIGTVTGSINNTGGLVGRNEPQGTISDDYSNVTVNGFGGTGGLVGNNVLGIISNTYSLGAVTAGSGSDAVGGLTGLNTGAISNSYSTGLVSGSGSTDVGGLVGLNSGGTVNASFWDTTTSGQSTSAGGTGDLTAPLLSESTYSDASWSIGTDPAADTWVIFDGQTRPMLGMEYSTTITNAHQLQLIGLNPTTLAASYTLPGNVDLTGITYAPDVWGTSTTNAGAGFVPIGNTTNIFTGTFNGERHTMSGLYILAPSVDNVGLFGLASGTIENVALNNLEVVGGSDVGGLVGAEGNANGGTPGTGTLSNVIVDGTVVGNGNYVGGLVGLDHGTLVFSAYTEGTVTGSGFVGGLEGSTLSEVSDVFSLSTVGASGGPVGGLLGENYTGGTLTNAYSGGVVAGNSEIGGLVGRNLGTITNSFWDTTTSNITSNSGGVGSGTSSGVTPATTTQLESQTFILQNAPNPPTWNFSTIWTTAGGTELPLLQDLLTNTLPSGSSPSGTDTLSGTAFTGSGVGESSGVTIDLLFDGTVIATDPTSGTGTFSFTVSSADLTGGILLTDATDNGNTFYQSNTPASAITGIDLWGNTLRVVADSASNSLLATTAGSFTSNGVNYSVSNSNLSTRVGINGIPAVDISILSHYTLDGNITAGGTLSTGTGSVLTGSTSVTLTGTSVAMAGTFNLSGSLSVDSTVGAIDLEGVGGIATSATAHGVSLTATGPVIVNNSYLATAGGDFSANGTGNSSNLDGVDVLTSSITAGGGSISLTGQSAFVEDEGQGGNVSGIGVEVNNSILQSALSGSGITTGDITIMGNASPGSEVTTVNNLIGTYITHSVLSVVNGALSITGDVNSGTAQAVVNEGGGVDFSSGRAIGVNIDDGSSVAATGTGSVSLTGDTTNSTAQISNLGVDLSGLDPNASTIVTSIVSAAGGLGVNITGTAGFVGGSPSGPDIQTPSTSGIVLEFGSEILASGTAPVVLMGTGGTDENTTDADLTNENSEGIAVEASPSNVASDSPNIKISSALGSISLTGTSGSSIGSVDGIDLHSEQGATASILSSGANISLNGFATNTADQTTSNTSNGGDAGVDIGVDNTGGSGSIITASAGSVYLHGVVSGGTLNSKEAGVVISRGATVTASGAGGSPGATAQGDVTIVGDTTGTTAQSLNGGVFIEGAGTVISASGIVADAHGGTGLTITGTSSALAGNSEATIDQQNGSGGLTLEPTTAGIAVLNGAEIESLGSSPTTLNGTGGANGNTLNSGTGYLDPATGGTSASYGVAIFSPLAEETTTVSSGGNLSITGASTSSPTTGVGVMIGGPGNAGAVFVTSAGAITIHGTGGSGYVTGSPVPNAGVGIFDPANDTGSVNIAANGGNLSITGTSGGGSNSTGVDGIPYFNSVDDANSNDPSLTASGILQIISDAGLINDTGWAGEIFALGTSVMAPTGTSSILTAGASGGPLSLTGGDFTVTGYPAGLLTLAASTVGNLTVTNNGGTAINGNIVASGIVNIQDTGGNITFGTNGAINDSATGNSVILAAGTSLTTAHYIINNSSSPNPIQVPNGSFYLYSSDPSNDSFGAITVQPDNVIFNATFATSGLPPANEELFYVATAGDVGPNAPGSGSGSPPPSTDTGGAAGGGSNIVPPALTPQPTPPVEPPQGNAGDLGNTPPPPNFSFTGASPGGQNGQQGGGLADSSGSGGDVGSGDAAQLGNGQLNNVANPQAAGVLGQALGPVVYHSLADALAALGDWAAPANAEGAGDDAGDGNQETILSAGDVAEIVDKGVKHIPPSQAPEQLRKALGGDVRQGMNAGVGH